jgi:glycosyltransferase 2 family protein
MVLAALLVYFSWQKLASFNWTAFAAVFRNVHWAWAALALLAVLATYWARVIRWRVMLLPLSPRPNLWGLFRATAIGFTSVVMLGRPGELVRPWLIARNEKVSFSSQLAAWFLERIFDLLAVLTLFGLGLWLYRPGQYPVGPAVEWVLNTGGGVIALLAAACLVILFFANRSGDALASRISGAIAFLPDSLRLRITSALQSFLSGMACCATLSSLAAIFLYTILEWGLIAAGTHAFFLAFPFTSHFSLNDSIIYVGFVAFGSIVQIPGIGGGVQIAGMIVLAQLFGLPTETAAGIAIANWLTTWVSILPFGIPMAASEGLQWSKLRHIAQDLESQDIQS